MLILGLLLVVASGAAAAVLIANNSGGTAETVTALGRDLGDFTMMQAFVAGIVVTLVFLLGLWMMLSAGKRGREHRARYREARREAKVAAKERDELAERVRRDDEVRAEQETAPHAVPTDRTDRTEVIEPVDGRPAATRDRSQPVITNIREGQSPTR